MYGKLCRTVRRVVLDKARQRKKSLAVSSVESGVGVTTVESDRPRRKGRSKSGV